MLYFLLREYCHVAFLLIPLRQHHLRDDRRQDMVDRIIYLVLDWFCAQNNLLDGRISSPFQRRPGEAWMIRTLSKNVQSRANRALIAFVSRKRATRTNRETGRVILFVRVNRLMRRGIIARLNWTIPLRLFGGIF